MWITKQRAGAKAQANGGSFENQFSNCCATSGITVTRIPDSCRQVSSQRMIRIRSPFDWILTYRGLTALIDTKTTQESTFAHSAIDWDQIEDLYAHEARGAIAGYVIALQEANRVIFLESGYLLTKQGIRGSISYDDRQAVVLGKSRDYGFRPELIFGGKLIGTETLQKERLL